MFHDLLLLAPEKLLIAVLNYAIIHGCYIGLKFWYRQWREATPYNLAAWNHYRHNHGGNPLDCQHEDCQILAPFRAV